MKKIYLLLFSICAFASFSQAPKLINYQGVARKASGLPITTPVKIKFEIFPSVSGGTSVFSEIQSTNTNSLGIFSTQIGKTSILSLNWDFGPYFLEVSIDTTNTGSSFIVVGRQQMVSVPYALYAQEAGSAPDPTVTYSNNILNVGSNSVNIPSGTVYSAGPDIAITSGSIMNTAPDKTITLTPAGNVLINGSYPNYTVGAVPQALGITSNTITLSNGGGSVVLPSTSNTPNTLVSGTGAATVTTSGTNTFNIAVAPVNISGSGATSVSGTYPNFLISSPTFSAPQSPTITGTGIANVNPSSGNNFTVNVPPSTLSYTGNVLTIVQGTSSSAVTIPAGVTPTITGQGIATVSPVSGNNFTVNVAPPNLVGAGITTVSGTYPTYTINTPAPPNPLPAWLLFGNAGTIDGAHFIGTTDNIPFNIRVNNQKSGRIDPLLSNTFFGYWSGRDNTNGTQNSAYGINSLLKNTVGVKNSVFGTAAMESNISGNNNTAQGAFALFSNTTGSTNVGIGSEAGYSNSAGSGNVFLGHKAGFNELGSNKLYIANSAINPPLIFGDFATGKVGIGTTLPSHKLTSDHSPISATDLQIKTHNPSAVTGAKSGIRFETGGGWAVQLQTSNGSNWLELTNNAGSIVHAWTFNRFYPGNTPVYVEGTATSLNLMGGNVGIGTATPANKLHVNGGVTIIDGTQGAGKVLASDATGNASWQPASAILVANPVSCQSLSGVGATPTKFTTDLATFTKINAGTTIEVILQTDINVGSLTAPSNSVKYELRLNGISSSGNTGKAVYYQNNGSVNVLNNKGVTMIGEFIGLAPGVYNVELWASSPAGGSASQIFYDPGCFGGSSVIVKENK